MEKIGLVVVGGEVSIGGLKVEMEVIGFFVF